MRLSFRSEKSYPKFTRYLKTQFPKLIHVAPVVGNIRKFGHLSLPEFVSATRYGTLPTIKITDLYHGQCFQCQELTVAFRTPGLRLSKYMRRSSRILRRHSLGPSTVV